MGLSVSYLTQFSGFAGKKTFSKKLFILRQTLQITNNVNESHQSFSYTILKKEKIRQRLSFNVKFFCQRITLETETEHHS